MYFIYPTRVSHQLDHELDRALALFADLQWIKAKDIAQYDRSHIFIADVHDFLNAEINVPTIVIASEDEGWALSQAWQKGALAGWIWQDLPQKPYEAIRLIQAQYKRNQDSRDLPLAADLQKRLLPNSMDFTNYQLRALFKPVAYLSGDWYDYWWVDETHLLFYLADVSGHGVTSSLLTSWMAAFHQRSHTPQRLLQKFNAMLLQQNIEMHITIVAGILDIQHHTVTCCNAGHFPPLTILSPQNEPKIMHADSMPLGLTDELKFSEASFDLAVGDRIFICSDGALEPYQGGLNTQFEQLIYDLKQSKFHAPEHVKDDIAILSLRRIS